MASVLFLCLVAAFASFTSAHLVLTYPGWRGDTLRTSGTPPAQNPDTIGVDYNNGSFEFPFGQEWVYPCGGMPLSKNRTLWPVTGGAVAFQPGWFQGHAIAFIYINIGINGPGDLAPPNMSHPVVPPFQIVGPTNSAYNGTVCLPQVPLPANTSLKVGDNITIQVVESAQHGAALYNCVDVTLAEPEDVPAVNSSVCFNSTNIGFRTLFTTSSVNSGALSPSRPSVAAITFALFMAFVLFAVG